MDDIIYNGEDVLNPYPVIDLNRPVTHHNFHLIRTCHAKGGHGWTSFSLFKDVPVSECLLSGQYNYYGRKSEGS